MFFFVVSSKFLINLPKITDQWLFGTLRPKEGDNPACPPMRIYDVNIEHMGLASGGDMSFALLCMYLGRLASTYIPAFPTYFYKLSNR